MEKVSIRFYHDHEVRAVWSEEYDKWFFSVLDVLAAINDEDDYQKTRNYWKYLKGKLKKESSELVSATTQLKLRAADGKKYNTDVLDAHGVVLLAKSVSNHRATGFLDWLTYSDNTIDGGFVQSQTAQIEAHSFVQSGIAQMPTTAIPPILCLITYTHLWKFLIDPQEIMTKSLQEYCEFLKTQYK